MNAKEKIGRLQGLLERVQARAGSPRTSGVVTASGSQDATRESVAVDHDAEVMSAAPVTPHMANAHPTTPPTSEAYDYDVEVSSEVVEVDIDIDEPIALESGAQPVAQPTIPPEYLEEEVDESPITTQPSAPPAELEEVAQTAAANEIEEPAPSSSRRPIAAEEEATEAYEAESAPRHTPPPESGRQVAAAPSTHPPPPRKSSTPPPSLEGHPLIGGWREPGLGAPRPQVGVGFGAGVRVPGPAAGRPAEPSSPVARPPVAPAQGSGPRLTADVTNPDLAASGEHLVAFEGAPAAPKPKTLGDLLDMTLAL